MTTIKVFFLSEIRNHAFTFSKQRFEAEIREFVESKKNRAD